MTRNIIQKGGRHYLSCKEYRKLVDAGKVCLEWFVCNCSSWERDLQIKNDKGEWKSINPKICPFCGVSIDNDRMQIGTVNLGNFVAGLYDPNKEIKDRLTMIENFLKEKYGYE